MWLRQHLQTVAKVPVHGRPQMHMLQRPSPFATAQGIGDRRPMPTVISPTASDGTASMPAAADDAASNQDGAW